jgi:hypothetical protein
MLFKFYFYFIIFFTTNKTNYNLTIGIIKSNYLLFNYIGVLVNELLNFLIFFSPCNNLHFLQKVLLDLNYLGKYFHKNQNIYSILYYKIIFIKNILSKN